MRISSDATSFAPVAAILLALVVTAAQGPAAQAQDLKLAKAKKPPSVCVGLDQSACGGKPECYWRKATTTKTGKSRRAHCRIKRSAAKTPPA
jgi:hypothetical protein